MVQKLLALLIILIGTIILAFPFVTGEKAYFIGENYYINLQDSIDPGYQPYLRSLIQKEQSKIAFQEKKAIREKLKLKGDSLEKAFFTATEKKQTTKIEQINIAKNELQFEINEKEELIDKKYEATNLPAEIYNEKLQKLNEKISKLDYVAAIANEMVNPSRDNTIESIKSGDITTQKVNLQNKKAFIISGIFILIAGIFLLLIQENIIRLEVKFFKLISISFLAVSCCFIAVLSYKTFADRIQFDNDLKAREQQVKSKLNDIRTLQITYFEAKNSYCNSWEKLKSFAKNDSIKLTKYLVNKDDTAAVHLAKKNGKQIEEVSFVPVLLHTFPDKKININEIDRIPFSKESFELNAGIINRNGRDVHVFEVRTTKYNFVKNLDNLPENFDKTSALILGSMTEPTTEGNW